MEAKSSMLVKLALRAVVPVKFSVRSLPPPSTLSPKVGVLPCRVTSAFSVTFPV